jgi:Skp family chaperone for outer membrane proteins
VLVVWLAAAVIVDRVRGTLSAQSTADREEESYATATLDLAKVFKKHEALQDRVERMRLEVAAADERLKRQRAALESRKKELERFEKSADEYGRLRTELMKLVDLLELDVKRQKEAFARQEAEAYFETYGQIEAVVQKYAARRNIKLVLRVNGDPIDRTNPEEVFKELNKSVIYHQGIDITDDILKMVNGQD